MPGQFLTDDQVAAMAQPAAPAAGSASGDVAPPGMRFLSDDQVAAMPKAPAAPAKVSGQPLTGVVANAGAGANDAIAGMAGAPVDLMTGAINLGSRGIKALTGYDAGQISKPFGGSESIKSGMGLAGVDPRNVQPATGGQNLARAAGAGLAGMMVPGLAAEALPAAAGGLGAVQRGVAAGRGAVPALAGAAGGVTGQVAADASPDWAKPLASMFGNVVGGGLALGGAAALGTAADRVWSGAQSAVRPMLGKAAPLLDASGAPIAMGDITGDLSNQFPVMAKPGQAELAGARLRSAATDPVAAQQALADTPPPAVPGVKPTTYQVTNDPGLGRLERVAAKNNSDIFIPRGEQNNAAMVDALQGVAPAAADPAAIGQAVRAQLDAHAAALGGDPAVPLAERGAAMQADLSGNDQAAKAAEQRLFDAVDRDGTVAVNMQPVRQAATEIRTGLSPNAAPMDGAEAAIFGRAQMMPAVQSFRDLQAFRTRVTTAMRAARQDPAQAQTYGRLSQLLGSLHEAMGGGAKSQAQADAQAVASGQMNPADAMGGRVSTVIPPSADALGDTNGRAFGVAGGAASRDIPGNGSSSAAGYGRAAMPAERRYGGPAGNPPVSRSPRAESFSSLLIRHGGIREESGELAAMGITNRTHPTLIRAAGMTHDAARELAIENGFIPWDSNNAPNVSSTSDVRNLLAEEASGRKQYTPEAAYEVGAARDQAMFADRQERDLENARDQVDEYLDELHGHNYGLPGEWVEAAARDVAQGRTVHEAVMDAQTGYAHEMLDADAHARYFGTEPGMSPLASQGGMDMRGGGGRLVPNFDADTLARYQAANAAHAERKGTFGPRAPGVGPVLAPGPTQGTFRMSPSSVPGALFGGGKASAERVAGYFKAGGSVPAARDYLASSFRNVAESGTPSRAQAWMAGHAEALKRFPDLEQTMRANVALRQSAAGRFLGEGDPVSAVGRILKGDTAAPDMKRLAELTAGNREARDGLKGAVRDYILRDLRSNTGLLKSDAYQTFTKRTPEALGAIFSKDELATLKGVSTELERAQRSIVGTKLAGGSNTAQDTAHAGPHSLMGDLVFAEMLEKLGAAVGGAVGAGAGAVLGGPLGGVVGGMAGYGATGALAGLNVMRAAGISHVQQLVELAAAHPPLARTLMARGSSSGSNGKFGLSVLRTQLMALTGAGALASQRSLQPTAPPPRRTAAPEFSRVSARM